MDLKKFYIKGKEYLVKINRIEKNKNIIYFEINGSIYKAKLLPVSRPVHYSLGDGGSLPPSLKLWRPCGEGLSQESNQLIVYIFNFNKSFIINLGSCQKTPNSNKSTLKLLSANKTDSNKFYCSLKSPLAGRVIKINVKLNQFVKKNQPLLTIESMKMENEIKTNFDAFIKNILISPSDLVEQNQTLITFEKNKPSLTAYGAKVGL